MHIDHKPQPFPTYPRIVRPGGRYSPSICVGDLVLSVPQGSLPQPLRVSGFPYTHINPTTVHLFLPTVFIHNTAGLSGCLLVSTSHHPP